MCAASRDRTQHTRPPSKNPCQTAYEQRRIPGAMCLKRSCPAQAAQVCCLNRDSTGTFVNCGLRNQSRPHCNQGPPDVSALRKSAGDKGAAKFTGGRDTQTGKCLLCRPTRCQAPVGAQALAPILQWRGRRAVAHPNGYIAPLRAGIKLTSKWRRMHWHGAPSPAQCPPNFRAACTASACVQASSK